MFSPGRNLNPGYRALCTVGHKSHDPCFHVFLMGDHDFCGPLYHVSCEALRIFWNDDTTCSTQLPRMLSTTVWKARNPARSRQHAWHSCRAGCIVISVNPQGLATHMVQWVTKVMTSHKKYMEAEVVSRVACKSRDFFPLEIHVGNTIELTWPSSRSIVFKCISITNTNFEKIEVTTFACDTNYDNPRCMKLFLRIKRKGKQEETQYEIQPFRVCVLPVMRMKPRAELLSIQPGFR